MGSPTVRRVTGLEPARVEILFDTPEPGATRIRTCNLSSADRVALLQDAISALAEAIATLGGTVNVTDLADVKGCARCGRMFRGLRSDARYCSLACRQGAYRDRRAGPCPASPLERQTPAMCEQGAPAQRTPALVKHWFE
jgi:hypothetical protein